MKVIITGGCGHIGTYLAPMLVRAGYEVVSVTRGQSAPYVPDIAWEKVQKVCLDRTREPEFARRIAAMRPDIVVDLINFHIDDTVAMVQALKGTAMSHYLFCSSIWAHGRAREIPFDPDDLRKEPLDEYGRQKFECELYLKERYRKDGFPATVVMPGQISGPGWNIINPWANTATEVFQKIANGEGISLPNLGMETLHHVHAEDVAQVFFQAISRRNQALGESFHAVSAQSITLYGYARLMYEFFGKAPRINFLPWDEWCKYVGDAGQTQSTYYHIARSGSFDISKERKLLDYRPRHTNIEAIKSAVQSYIDRGLIAI